MSQNKKKIIIAGGGFAGVKAALELCENARFEVTLISDNDDFRYYPSLYHTATGGSRDVSVIPLSEIFTGKKIRVIKASAEKLNREEKSIRTDSGESYAYDDLILALGVVTNFFNIPGLKQHAYGIKTPEDAESFKKHLHKQLVEKKRPDQNYVIVGGGPTGIELAGVLGEYVKIISRKHGIMHRAINIELIEAAPRLIPRMPKDMARSIARQLRRRGVKLYFNTAVKAQTAEELVINERPIKSHTVVWTAGTVNHPFFAANRFQLAKGGKVRTNQFLMAEQNIYVVGDNADTPYSGLAQTALYDGQYVGRHLILSAAKQNPKPYRAKKPIYVLPAGPNWAAVQWRSVRVYGRLGWILRRAADFIAYRDYEPWFRASRHWLAEYERDELCPLCDEKPGIS